jgi:hypothetical protein
MCICHSPKLIAAYHVLHRLQEPRHPPYALNYFLFYWANSGPTYLYSLLRSQMSEEIFRESLSIARHLYLNKDFVFSCVFSNMSKNVANSECWIMNSECRTTTSEFFRTWTDRPFNRDPIWSKLFLSIFHFNYPRSGNFPFLHPPSPRLGRTMVEDNGFEPMTPCVQGRCSSQLS